MTHVAARKLLAFTHDGRKPRHVDCACDELLVRSGEVRFSGTEITGLIACWCPLCLSTVYVDPATMLRKTVH